jgi:uridine phosphorylase
VTGSFIISPPMGMDFPTSGTVTLAMQGAPHTHLTVRVGTSGHFRMRVSLGKWVVTGRTQKYGDGRGVCGGDSINVTVNQAASVTVWCLEK